MSKFHLISMSARATFALFNTCLVYIPVELSQALSGIGLCQQWNLHGEEEWYMFMDNIFTGNLGEIIFSASKLKHVNYFCSVMKSLNLKSKHSVTRV